MQDDKRREDAYAGRITAHDASEIATLTTKISNFGLEGVVDDIPRQIDDDEEEAEHGNG